jgi:hypothetical protein
MGDREKEIADEYLRGLSPSSRRFRINAGQAWAAAPKDTLHVSKPTTVRVYPGDVVLHRARVFHGAPTGFFDYCGWDEVLITQDMVGQKVAIFCGDELKSEHDRLRPEQKRLGQSLEGHGGRWRVIHLGSDRSQCA